NAQARAGQAVGDGKIEEAWQRHRVGARFPACNGRGRDGPAQRSQGRRLQNRVHEAEVFSDHDRLLRRGYPEAIEGPDARWPPDLKRGAHYERVEFERASCRMNAALLNQLIVLQRKDSARYQMQKSSAGKFISLSELLRPDTSLRLDVGRPDHLAPL